MSVATTEVPFDVSFFEARDTATLQVLTVRGQPLLGDGGRPVTIEMYGPGSEQYAAASAAVSTAVQARTFAAIRGKGEAEAEAAVREATVAKLAACTKAIHHFPVEPAALYSNRRLSWITDQAARFVEDWSHFLPGSNQS
jgi:hypothetical protein